MDLPITNDSTGFNGLNPDAEQEFEDAVAAGGRVRGINVKGAAEKFSRKNLDELTALVAQFKANWLGGGTLVFNDGECFQLTAKGFCRPVWSWVNHQGMKLLEVIPHHKTVRVTGTPGTDAWNSAQSKLPVLIMFSWHQILQTNDDAAAVAAISAAAAG